ncbi:MAG: hypothetical protein J7501_18000 [Bdellovibrio sp.]|nr:hypothetical protein [Bdellovibrio sp.]
MKALIALFPMVFASTSAFALSDIYKCLAVAENVKVVHIKKEGAEQSIDVVIEKVDGSYLVKSKMKLDMQIDQNAVYKSADGQVSVAQLSTGRFLVTSIDGLSFRTTKCEVSQR